MKDHARFIEAAPPFLHLNRMVNALEIYKICIAKDGRAFDRHWDHILAAEQETDYGQEAEPLPRLETRAGEGGPAAYRISAAERWPWIFTIFCELAEQLGKETFVEALMAPTQVALWPGERLGLLPKAAVALAQTCATMSEQHCAAVSGLFEPALLEELHSVAEQVPYKAMRHATLGVDFTMDFSLLLPLVMYLVTDERLILALCSALGLARQDVGHLVSRVYRMQRGRDRDTYHDDVHHYEHRLFAVTFALHRQCPKGGALLLKKRRELWAYASVRPNRLGDLNFFRISRHLRHRAQSLKGPGFRTVFVGWYCARPGFDYPTWLDKPLPKGGSSVKSAP